MSSCCARHGQEELFSDRMASRDAKRYRRKGPDPVTRSVVRGASARGLDGVTVLEIGGGVGQVALELVKAGAERGEVVELLPVYERHARELAEEAGVADRTSFRTADLVADEGARREADVVALNRVVCCTPDGVELAGIAAALARRTLVLSLPREAVWTKAAFAALNLAMWLLRRRFRTYVHPVRAIRAAVEAQGLRLASERAHVLFQVSSFERA